jgi:hypothetical protein
MVILFMMLNLMVNCIFDDIVQMRRVFLLQGGHLQSKA